jgi:hypothetical protein
MLAMTVSALVLFLLALAPQSVATAAAAPEAPRDLVVSSYYWGRIDSEDIDVESPFPGEVSRARRRRGFDPNAVRVVRRETYALVRNSGTRKIKVVSWDYVFYEDAAREREIKRFPFRSKETIPPGETKFLSEQVDEGPPSSYGGVVVRRIDYDDGTSWVAGGAPK